MSGFLKTMERHGAQGLLFAAACMAAWDHRGWWMLASYLVGAIYMMNATARETEGGK